MVLHQLPTAYPEVLEPENFLKQCERIWESILRRSWQSESMKRKRAIAIAKKVFDSKNASMPIHPLDENVQATILANMYWCGCRHPGQLNVAPLHPPTGLVRWLSQFSLVEQCTAQRQILNRLAAEIRLIFQICKALVQAMKARYRAFKMLPELVQLVRNQRFAE